MARSSADWEWGSWVVGDLADTVRRAAELLGGTFEAVRVCAAPPVNANSCPRVLVVVTDEHTSKRLRARVRDGEAPCHFFAQPAPGRWRAEVDDLDLTVSIDEEGLW